MTVVGAHAPYPMNSIERRGKKEGEEEETSRQRRRSRNGTRGSRKGARGEVDTRKDSDGHGSKEELVVEVLTIEPNRLEVGDQRGRLFLCAGGEEEGELDSDGELLQHKVSEAGALATARVTK